MRDRIDLRPRDRTILARKDRHIAKGITNGLAIMLMFYAVVVGLYVWFSRHL
jgi:hypothetical protein